MVYVSIVSFLYYWIVSSAIRYANIYSSRGSSGSSYSFTCSGYEDQLLNCPKTSRYCYWWSDPVGVRCYGKQIKVATLVTDIKIIYYHLVTSSCTEGNVRLAGGETVMEGRVEVCHNQTWWAVSGYWYWDFNDATVVCRHLHYAANCEWWKKCNSKTSEQKTHWGWAISPL